MAGDPPRKFRCRTGEGIVEVLGVGRLLPVIGIEHAQRRDQSDVGRHPGQVGLKASRRVAAQMGTRVRAALRKVPHPRAGIAAEATLLGVEDRSHGGADHQLHQSALAERDDSPLQIGNVAPRAVSRRIGKAHQLPHQRRIARQALGQVTRRHVIAPHQSDQPRQHDRQSGHQVRSAAVAGEFLELLDDAALGRSDLGRAQGANAKQCGREVSVHVPFERARHV